METSQCSIVYKVRRNETDEIIDSDWLLRVVPWVLALLGQIIPSAFFSFLFFLNVRAMQPFDYEAKRAW
jgi:hypothetical protein